MLGGIHCSVNVFPDIEEIVARLTNSDQAFTKLNDRYNALYEEIRHLELNDAPVGDNEMHALKHERAELKDELYQLLISAKS